MHCLIFVLRRSGTGALGQAWASILGGRADSPHLSAHGPVVLLAGGSGCCPAAATPPGCRPRSTGDSLRPRPRPAAGHQRQGRRVRVSIATLDDMRVLYDGFDLCAPDISVSMTINGRAGHPGDVPQHRHRRGPPRPGHEHRRFRAQPPPSSSSSSSFRAIRRPRRSDSRGRRLIGSLRGDSIPAGGVTLCWQCKTICLTLGIWLTRSPSAPTKRPSTPLTC